MEIRDFKAIRISLASPEEIRSWSYGEVTKPETINYRRLRPEKDGLFCEAIFGPTRDWQCYCGKYKKIRYRGIVCDKCGVEVTRSRVRRERMGHIELASPVAHIWYTRRVPSYLGLLLNISRRNLDRVLYFAQYIISKSDENERKRVLHRLEEDFNKRSKEIMGGAEEEMEEIRARLQEEIGKREEQVQANVQRLSDERDETASKAVSAASALNLDKDQGVTVRVPRSFEPAGETIVAEGETIGRDHTRRRDRILEGYLSQIEAEFEEARGIEEGAIQAEKERVKLEFEGQIQEIRQRAEGEIARLHDNLETDREELQEIKVRQLINESRFRALKDKWGNVFRAGMGAEALLEILEEMDLDDLREKLRREIKTTRSKQRKKKATKRLKVVEALRRSGNRPEWMVLAVLPVIPPDLRPMVQLDGGRFATSDLNDLYRRVINRNNRLKRLLELGAPDVIIRNEKRMLQEAVDSLIDNSRRGKAVSFRGKRQLKSLSDMLKGKQGRFRRNLLGKRVDYSGRSVIVIGPELKLHQCGLPKTMALELFRPFVMRKLVEYGHAHNVKGAKRVIELMRPEVWEVLEEVIQDYPVLLNRAPTLHRLGIQAFEPVLVEGKAIQIHPLVCFAFNADFDGDQMAVHIPLSERAKREARELMMSNRNLLLPANGEPVVGPTKDMVMGAYYCTMEHHEMPLADGRNGEGHKLYGDLEEVALAYELGRLKLHQPIRVHTETWFSRDGDRRTRKDRRIIGTTVGRVLFNLALPPELRFHNETMDKGRLKAVVADCYTTLGPEATAELVDEIKALGFHYATQSGITIAVEDLTVPEDKARILEETAQQITQVESQYRRGLITAQEMYEKTIDLWTRATDEITDAVAQALEPDNSLRLMASSGATKGGFTPIRQLAGMRGLMADPAGRIIDLPIRSNFREGLTALEYFISTHGARKGLADTALRTADAGYLTRRLVDVAQDAIVNEEDCGSRQGVWVRRTTSQVMGESFRERAFGRVLASDAIDPKSGKVLLPAGTLLNEEEAEALDRSGIEEIYVRSPLGCTLRYGVCGACYGRDLARGGVVALGEAVGIIAAQSIGEPGTQLTLRTFHTGGVAEGEDITHGLPRVQELFEARNPKGQAIVTDIAGQAEIEIKEGLRRIVVRSQEVRRESFDRRTGYYRLLVEEGDPVEPGTPILARGDEEIIETQKGGRVKLDAQNDRLIVEQEVSEEVAYDVPPAARLRVEAGDTVEAGQALTEGPKNPHRMLQILGREEAQEYLLEEIQNVYRSQGVVIHDKHVEMILRQMFSKVRVTNPGETELLLGDLVNRVEFEETNRQALEAGGQPATAQPVLLGITKAALNTESFLAASSFQHTINVLASAAIEGKVDQLRGLKENVIIGKLIPAGTGFWTNREPEEEDIFAFDGEVDAEALEAFRLETERLGETGEGSADDEEEEMVAS